MSRSTVCTLRPREKKLLVFAIDLSVRETLPKSNIRVARGFVPQQPEHSPVLVLADQLNRVHAATERLARRLFRRVS